MSSTVLKKALCSKALPLAVVYGTAHCLAVMCGTAPCNLL